MNAHSQEKTQPVLLIDPTVQSGQATIGVLAEVTRPNVYPTQGIVKQSHRINTILPKGITPYKRNTPDARLPTFDSASRPHTQQTPGG